MSDSIQKIKRVPLRELWRKEDKDFTKWLEEHIDFLNDAMGNLEAFERLLNGER